MLQLGVAQKAGPTIDPRERFTATVGDYRKHRPDYPAELIDWILADGGLAPGDGIVDIGCGTGITSRLFAARGLRVVGVDPNAAMLAAARSEGSAVDYREGEAARLPLQGGSVRGAVSGQAFHWFDLDLATAELRRVLVPGGRCAAFWNERDDSFPLMAQYERLLLAHCPAYPVASASETIARMRGHGRVTHAREACFAHRQVLDRDAMIGRVWSSSYVARGIPDEAGFRAALHDLFDRHRQGGVVEFRYRTPAITFEPGAG